MKRLIVKLGLLLVLGGMCAYAVESFASGRCPLGEIPCGKNLSQCCVP
jgi:hypothetical protein